MIRTYSELITLPTYEERYEYLLLDGQVGKDTFGYDRYLNQMFYQSPEWKYLRKTVILRDNGCDMGLNDYQIYGKIYVHHINPLTKDDITRRSKYLLDPEYLISVSFNTHQGITYGVKEAPITTVVIRQKNDTCPWR